MKLSCSAYQAGSSYAQKILTGNQQNYGATSSTAQTSGGADGSHGLIMPSWKNTNTRLTEIREILQTPTTDFEELSRIQGARIYELEVQLKNETDLNAKIRNKYKALKKKHTDASNNETDVEEIEGKGSPNENAESPNDGGYGGIGSQEAHKSHGGSGGGAGGLQQSSRHNSQSSSRSDASHPPPNSDSTASKTHASSCSPSDSPAHRLEGRSRSKSVGEQQWTNLRAVLAWYARLRKIKRSRSNQRWMKLRTTVQLSSAITSTIQKKAPLKREDSFLKRFSTRQIPESQTFEFGEDEDDDGSGGGINKVARKKKRSLPRSVVNPDGSFYFYWLMLLTVCVLYNLWTLIVRQSFPELQEGAQIFWILTDAFCDLVFVLDVAVQFRTGYLEQGLMVFKTKKLARHYIGSKPFYLDLISLIPTDFFQLYFGANPMFRFPRFMKLYRIYHYYYMVESRTVYPNVWRVVNLIHILLLLAHWFGCFYYVLSEAEGFRGPWVYPNPNNPNNSEFAPLTRKYLGSLYWSTLTLTTIGDLPTPYSNWQYLFTIVSYLIGVFIFATIVGQVGNVITNRNANRLEFERLLDGAKTYMRHHKVPRDMQRRVLRWYDYSWSRGRIQGGGDINTALGLLPDKLKTELALHVNLSVLKKVTIFQECQPEFLHDLVLKMKAYIFTPGDLICRKGEVAREMFIIADGILEVISELGKVLTTMQAGDFFGEIGILNLDGLNKRTADVRSVGYSELFSLSREDVLAAMKDYPEAQEILQTLGRKRLMEARKASGPAVPKKVEPKKISSPLAISLSSHSISKGPDIFSDDETPMTDLNTGKRIVEKLRNDVKGLRNAIRRSRKSNSSKDDSSEPESGKGDDGVRNRHGKKELDSNQSFPPPRGMLKRMHHVVLSDDREKEPSTSASSSPSMSLIPIRAKKVQLPLGKASAQANTTATSPDHEIEVIGAGLPLIHRLRLLRQKEERERKQQEERENMLKSLIPSPEILQASKPRSTSEIPPPESPIISTRATVEALPKPPGKTKTGKWSKLKIRKDKKEKERTDSVSSVESASPRLFGSPPTDGRISLSPPRTFPTSISPSPATHLSQSPPMSKMVSAPITATKKRSPAETVSGEAVLLDSVTATPSQTEEPPPEFSIEPMPTESSVPQILKDYPIHSGASSAPGSFFGRPSALSFKQKNAKTYGSVDDLSPEFSRLPFIRKLQILNERQKIADILRGKCGNTVLTRSTSEGSSETAAAPSVQSGEEQDEQLHSVTLGRRTQSNREQMIPVVVPQTSDLELSKPDKTPPDISPPISTFMIMKAKPEKEHDEQQNDDSEEDSSAQKELNLNPTKLSPVSQVRGKDDERRKHGDAETTSENYRSSNGLRRRIVEFPSDGAKQSTPTPKRKKKEEGATHYQAERSEERDADGENEGEWGLDVKREDYSPSPPLSPENNETPERRNLKSILKRLAESAAEDETKVQELDPDVEFREYQKLIRAPTLEGFAARHRKFSKNVTFQRHAVNIISPEGAPADSMINHWQIQPQPLQSPNFIQPIRQDLYTTSRTEGRCEFYDYTNGNSNSNSATGSGWPVVPILSSPPPARRHHMSAERLRNQVSKSAVVKREREVDPSDSSSLSTMGIGTVQEECIGGVFMGIRNIIRIKMEEIQGKFQDRFQVLETEVKRRDEIITVLQLRIQELEDKTLNQAQQLVTCRLRHKSVSSLTADSSTAVSLEEDSRHQESRDKLTCEFSGGNARSRLTEKLEETDLLLDEIDDDYEDDDDDVVLHEHPSLRTARTSYPLHLESSYLFSRGDSIDTVISNQDFDDDVFERADIECAPEASQLLQEEREQLTTWAQIAEEETIEMSEFSQPTCATQSVMAGRAAWEHEFHRDRESFQFNRHLHIGSSEGKQPQASTSGTSVPTQNPPHNISIAELSDYENSSSSEDEPKKKGITELACRDKTPRNYPTDIEEGRMAYQCVEEEEEQEERDDYGVEVYEETDEDSDDFNNLNWEAKMLAKEMKKKEDEKEEKTKATVGEMLKLENEIRKMQDCFAGGVLTPSELDMLESVLESKTKRVKALYKACSMDTDTRRSSFHPPPSNQPFIPAQSSIGRSYDDFRRSSAPLPTTASSYYTQAHLQRMLSMGMGTGAHSRSQLSLAALTEFSKDSQKQSTSYTSSTNRLSPGERRDLQKLVYSRKKTSMRRQASLCETRDSRRESPGTTSTASSAALSASALLGRHRQVRRESAGAISTDSAKSFFSRLSFVRQFTSSRTVGDAQTSPEQLSAPCSVGRDKEATGQERRDSASSKGSSKGSPSSSSRKSSSSTLPPDLHLPPTTLSSSSPMPPTSTAAVTSFPTPTLSSQQTHGESQPLLKK